mmetsp:Transcript_47913/g.133570  ORF Transcript_47913/g.133570 Transcript_47913/m.133570 type:complete len:215 (-) Transcript_47913:641-1285(-)
MCCTCGACWDAALRRACAVDGGVPQATCGGLPAAARSTARSLPGAGAEPPDPPWGCGCTPGTRDWLVAGNGGGRAWLDNAPISGTYKLPNGAEVPTFSKPPPNIASKSTGGQSASSSSPIRAISRAHRSFLRTREPRAAAWRTTAALPILFLRCDPGMGTPRATRLCRSDAPRHLAWRRTKLRSCASVSSRHFLSMRISLQRLWAKTPRHLACT